MSKLEISAQLICFIKNMLFSIKIFALHPSHRDIEDILIFYRKIEIGDCCAQCTFPIY